MIGFISPIPLFSVAQIFFFLRIPLMPACVHDISKYLKELTSRNYYMERETALHIILGDKNKRNARKDGKFSKVNFVFRVFAFSRSM